MLDIKLLNTLLFSNKDTDLIKAVKKVSDTFIKKTQDILLYAMAYNKSLTSELTGISTDFLAKHLSDEDIVNRFYQEEKNNSFFGFKSLQVLEEAKNSIQDIHVKSNIAKKAYNNINIKTKELSKASLNSPEATRLGTAIKESQAILDKAEMQLILKIIRHDLAKDQYVKLFKLSKLIADHIEENNTESDGLANKHAYDITICFGGKINQDIVEKLQSFLKDKGFFNAEKPIHDTFATFTFPENKQKITLKKWQELISKHGKEAMDLFRIADHIELKKANLAGIIDQHVEPDSLHEAKLLKAKLSYSRADEYLELAELALHYNLSEKIFNQCLEIETQRKASDNLPNIIIHGKEVGNNPGNIELDKYHLVKLPINDPRAYILGEITNCCQSIGGSGEKSVIDGITRVNNGFYVLLKSKNSIKQNVEIFKSEGKIDYQNFDIVGQGYAWLSKAGNLTFDSWENLRNQEKHTFILRDDAVIMPILEEFAKQVCGSTDIDRVTIGRGGKTPKIPKSSSIKYPEYIKEGHNYGDAKSQALLGEKIEFIELKNLTNNKLETFSSNTKNNSEVSKVDRVKKILNLIKNDQNFNELFANAKGENLNLLNQLFNYSKIEDFTYDYFHLFLNLPDSKIKVLSSPNALKGYQNKYFTFNDLKDFEIEKITALIAPVNDLFGPYKYYSINDLKDVEIEKIKILTINPGAFVGYQRNYFTINDLKDLSIDKITALTLSAVINKGFANKYFTIEDFKDLSIEKIFFFTSPKVLEDYNRYYTFNELKNLEPIKAKILTLHKVIEGYARGIFTFDQLKDLEISKLKTLITSNNLDEFLKTLGTATSTSGYETGEPIADVSLGGENDFAKEL